MNMRPSFTSFNLLIAGGRDFSNYYLLARLPSCLGVQAVQTRLVSSLQWSTNYNVDSSRLSGRSTAGPQDQCAIVRWLKSLTVQLCSGMAKAKEHGL